MNQLTDIQPPALKRGENELVEINSIQPRSQKGSSYPYWIALVELDETEVLTVEIRTDDRPKFHAAGWRGILEAFTPASGLAIAVTLRWQPIKRRKTGGRWVVDRIMTDGPDEKPAPHVVPPIEDPIVYLDDSERIKRWNEDLAKWKTFTIVDNTIYMMSDLWGKVTWDKTPFGYTRKWQDSEPTYYQPKKAEAA